MSCLGVSYLGIPLQLICICEGMAYDCESMDEMMVIIHHDLVVVYGMFITTHICQIPTLLVPCRSANPIKPSSAPLARSSPETSPGHNLAPLHLVEAYTHAATGSSWGLMSWRPL